MIALHSRYEQKTTKIPQKYRVLQTIYTPYALFVRGHTHKWMDSIYSIFKDKLLLLGEQVYSVNMSTNLDTLYNWRHK